MKNIFNSSKELINNFIGKENVFIFLLLLAICQIIISLVTQTASTASFILHIVILVIGILIINRFSLNRNVDYNIFILVVIIINMFNLNFYGDCSYSWIKNNSGKYKKAPAITFNPFEIKTLTKKIIVRDNNFGYGGVTDDKPVIITMEKGIFNINLRAKVDLSRETWKEFNYNNKELRKFLREDIKNKLLKDFESCDIQKFNKFSIHASYDGKRLVKISLE